MAFSDFLLLQVSINIIMYVSCDYEQGFLEGSVSLLQHGT